jgi:hypothetical protein
MIVYVNVIALYKLCKSHNIFVIYEYLSIYNILKQFSCNLYCMQE